MGRLESIQRKTSKTCQGEGKSVSEKGGGDEEKVRNIPK